MGSFNPFSKPKITKPTPPPVVKVPTATESAEDIAAAQEEEKQKRKRQKGRAATILSNGDSVVGDDATSGLAVKKLFGQ